jgi:hypothetical protein
MAHCEPKRLNQAPQWIGVIYRHFRKTDQFASEIMKSAIKDSRQTFSDQVRVSRSSFNFNGRVYDSNVMSIRNLAFSTVSSISWNDTLASTPSYPLLFQNRNRLNNL